MLLTPGTRLGPYEILAAIGAGGMGEVYKARDTRLGRVAALKVMRPESVDEGQGSRRFLREAQAAAGLNHPGILTIYDVGADEGRDYIAMEFVTGGTLADLMAAGPLPVERALQVGAQVADALAVAHAAAIVHRDLKPSNIMVPAPDRVKVVDFGLAKRARPAGPADETIDTATASGSITGTVPYMSPEQASGVGVDSRSDLFSLGTILYEMLAGSRPFRGETGVATLAAILRDTPAPIPGISPDVAAVLNRCLRKNPAERFQSAVELKAAIDACRSVRADEGRPSVAVLPFTSMTGVKEDDYLCEGLAEEIIDALTRIPALRVIARTSAFAVARLGLDVREAAARLGAGHVLEGSVRRAGSRVRVTAQLVLASDGSHVWSERYDRELTNVLDLEDEIAAAIAARLRVELAGGQRRPPERVVDGEAHAAYLEGRYHFARGTPESLSRAAACYERALARDPSFALAYDSLGELHWYLGFFGNAPPREAFSRSTWYALRALELDDTLAQTHALLGMLRKELDYNWAEVDRELGRARELNGESPLVRLRHAISGLLPHGRVDEALTEIDGILQSDPLSLVVRWWLSIMAYLARRPARMIEEGRHMIALDPTHFFGHWTLGMGLIGTGDFSDAVAALKKAHELSGCISFTLGFLAYGCGCAGRREEVERLLAGAIERAAQDYVPPTTLALAYVGLDDWDRVLHWMDRAIEGRDPIIMPIKTYPFLDPVRGDARFGALLKKMHLMGG